MPAAALVLQHRRSAASAKVVMPLGAALLGEGIAASAGARAVREAQLPGLGERAEPSPAGPRRARVRDAGPG